MHHEQACNIVRVRGGLGNISAANGARAVLRQLWQASEQSPDSMASPQTKEMDGASHGRAVILTRSTKSDFNTIPPGFRKLAQHQLLSDCTIQIIARVVQQLLKGGSAQKIQISQYYESFSEACPALFSSNADPFESLLNVGLLRYCANRVGRRRDGLCRFGTIGPFGHIPSKTSHALPNIELRVATAAREALLWYWITSIDSWSLGLPSGVLAARGMTLLSRLPEQFPETRTWRMADFEALGNRFFWRKEILAWLRPAWVRVMQLRPNSPVQSMPVPTISTVC